MNSAPAKYVELVERRLELFRALIRLEGDWRSAFVALNLQTSGRLAADQETICHQIHFLDKHIASLKPTAHAQRTVAVPKGSEVGNPKAFEADPVHVHRIRVAESQTAELQLELLRLNQIKRGILKRSKLTIGALRNLFNSYAPTYAAPTVYRAGATYEERV